MVGRCDNCYQNKERIKKTEPNVKCDPKLRFSDLSWLEGASEDSGMVHHDATNGEGICKVHRGHGGQGVDVFAFHPYTLSVISANTVEEAVLRREQPWWHARIKDENREGKEIRQSHGPPDDCEGIERRRNIIEPPKEAGKCQFLDALAYERDRTYPTVPGMWIKA